MKINKDERGIEFISIKNSEFYILTNDVYKLFFVLRVSNKIIKKNIQNHLKNIEKLFINTFKDNLKDFSAEISTFNLFESTFLEYFEKNI